MTDEVRRNLAVNVDIKRILQLLATSLLSRKDLILRELIQNAHDALLMRVLDDPNFSESLGRISLVSDKSGRSFVVKDNGCGMTASQLEVLFETIGATAKSLDAARINAEKAGGHDVIGQFGMGFLSNYAVADSIEIVSRPWYRHEHGFHALLDAMGHITITPLDDAESPGTAVILHLNRDGEFLLEPQTVFEIVKALPPSVRFPILLGDQVIRETLHAPVAPSEADFSRLVARVLRDGGLSFEAEAAIGGLKSDFLVRGPDGQLVVVEARNWEARPGYISRAISQVEHYKKATGADAAFVVLANASEDHTNQGVVTLNGLVNAIRTAVTQPRSTGEHKAILKRNRTVFAAMPFSASFDDVFFVAMAPAAEQVDAICIRIDQEEFSDDIVAEIQRLIRRSVAVIADLSESRPNVLYETGYAHALGVPVAHICSTSLTNLPFDVRNWNTIAYQPGQTFRLREKLAERLRAIISRNTS